MGSSVRPETILVRTKNIVRRYEIEKSIEMLLSRTLIGL